MNNVKFTVNKINIFKSSFIHIIYILILKIILIDSYGILINLNNEY